MKKTYLRQFSLSVLLLIALFSSITVASDFKPTRSQKRISTANAVVLSQYHYEKLPLDNNLSLRIYDSYLRVLDPQKLYFLQEDINEFNQYALQFDNFIVGSKLEKPYEMYERLILRMKERNDYVESIIDSDFNLNTHEKILTDRKNEPYANTTGELNSIWYKRVKNELINIIIADTPDVTEARGRLKKRYNVRLNRFNQSTQDDFFDIFMNAIASSYDPHSNYYSAKQMENFNINMSLSLQGIGTVLKQDEDSVKIMEIIPGGPADLSNKIAVSDEIIGVAQGDDGEFLDIVGMRLDMVVEKVRGKKGTVVLLQLLGNKGKGPEKIVRIIRDNVKLEEQAAKSELKSIFSNEKNRDYKVGVITLPTFYSDFEGSKKGDKDFRSTTRDVKNLLSEMAAQNEIDGLVIDLRGNGGGSLQEVIDLSTLFLEDGNTIVQTRSFDGKIDEQASKKETKIYDGPLIVMIDRLSASASEIFSGSMQDQGRALIVGSKTFGKGTVQTLINLEALLSKSEKPGQTKVTVAKFYRANGESTQEKGVIPDIELPSFYDEEEIGESKEFYVLPWDKIKAATDYVAKMVLSADLLDVLKKQNQERLDNDEKLLIFQKQVASIMDIWKTKEISLNLDERLKDLKQKEEESLNNENKLRTLYGFDELTLEQFKNEDGSYTKMLKEHKPDVLLDETINIMRDYIDLVSLKE